MQDPSTRPERGFTVEYIRFMLLRYLVQQIPFRILTFLLIIVDIVLVTAEVIIG